MYINHNGMASNVANTLTSHYSNLATSTERLSSGLRVNSAADDAAGLAIRELMRADIAALNQGVRNANDAISLIQTADGALGIIDEKLIRMKELAEQAATGTYDSTQRLMIESEYQAMASEITRIANATDFNGMKLLDGTLEGTHDGSKLESTGAMKIHFGTANDSAEDYYYIEIEEMTAQALGVGNASTWEDVAGRAEKAYVQAMKDEINSDKYASLTDAQRGEMLAQVEASGAALKQALMDATDLADINKAYAFWSASDGLVAGTNDDGFLVDGKQQPAGNGTLINEFLVAGARQTASENGDIKDATDFEVKAILDKVNAATAADVKALTGLNVDDGAGGVDTTEAGTYLKNIASTVKNVLVESGMSSTDAATTVAKLYDGTGAGKLEALVAGVTDPDDWATDIQAGIDGLFTVAAGADDPADTTLSADIVAFVDDKASKALATFDAGLRNTEREKLAYAMGQAAMYNLANGDKTNATASFGMGLDGTLNFSVKDAAGNELPEVATIRQAALDKAFDKIKDMDFAGHTIETQEDAQHALVALDAAITQKDKTRAHLGALQNRLENTVSNLTVQSENLQAAESRISDVDVATEMTNFVRNQILTQSAVAMLSQANSMPQMAMQLIH